MTADRFHPIEFHATVHQGRLLVRDAATGELAEAATPVEFRTDPLTGRTLRLVPFSLDRIIRPDLDALEQQSRQLFCPFCPPNVTRITPVFPPDLVPEGAIRIGEAYGFPNLGPYDVYGAVIVLSPERHFVRLDAFDAGLVADALLAAHAHLQRVARADPAARYRFIAWNYMPASGGSLVHPHLQSNAGYYPTNLQRETVEASERYRAAHGSNYWSDLLEQERRLGERYIGRLGGAEWLTAFAPLGRLSDIVAVFPGRASVLDLTGRDLRDLAAGLLKVFSWLDRRNLVSFNLATYSGFDAGSFWTHVRLTPRGSLLYSPVETSDQFYYQTLQEENVCILPPETSAAMLRPSFTG
jgi:UDPglucose--hexose-1-phosphate uridylyltransferase